MKKILFGFIAFIAMVTLLFSCQKEITEEIPSSVSQFILQGAPDTCTTAIVSGYYAAGSALTDSNTVAIDVNVTYPGTYTITTETINGYHFADSGVFVLQGIQKVVLKGIGTPDSAKTSMFTPRSPEAGTIGCTFKITVGAPVPAVYTYSGAPDTCTVATVNGLYGINTPLAVDNTVSVQVNVTAKGSYRITTDTVKGIYFSKSGVFSTTGIQTVTLAGAGTPTVAGIDTLKIGTGGCTFKVPVAGPSVFTTSGAPNACTVAVVSGLYILGTPLTADDSVKVQVNVTTAGSYTISTNTVGGMTFSKSGVFGTTGIQTVILTGSGTPTTVGANSLKLNTTGCTFNVTVIGPATYTLAGAPNACTVATVGGSYSVGTTLNAADTVVIQVNVTVTGAYTISTGTVGGMMFTKTGVFTTTGVHTVTLAGSGVPTIAGANAFTAGTGGCTFNVTVAAPTGIYNCKIDGVYTSFTDRAQADTSDDVNTPSTPYLYLDGFTGPPNGNNVPELQIFINKNDNSAIGTGSYNVDGFLMANGYRIEIDYYVVNPDLSVTIWNTSSTLLSPNPPFTITITSITATKVTGTFSGTLTDTLLGGTHTKTVTEGVFDLPIN